MEGWAALITAVAALIGVLVWPLTLLVLVVLLRGHINVAAGDLPAILRRMRRFKLGAFEAELDAKAEVLVDEAIAKPGEISPRQITTTAGITLSAQALDEVALKRQLERLCIEFDTIRDIMPAGYERSRAMVSVLVRLRTLGSAIERYLPELKAGTTGGQRLAAIAIMQVNPAQADIPWLVQRFRSDPPFLLFQSAAVLRALLRREPAVASAAAAAAGEALAIVRAYPGEPDADTMELLEAVSAASGATDEISAAARGSLPG